MPDYVVGKITNALNSVRKAVNGSRILILGVAYKLNVSDVRESPAVDIIHLLLERGADISNHGSLCAQIGHRRLVTAGYQT